jgi:hypothetical protein
MLNLSRITPVPAQFCTPGMSRTRAGGGRAVPMPVVPSGGLWHARGALGRRFACRRGDCSKGLSGATLFAASAPPPAASAAGLWGRSALNWERRQSDGAREVRIGVHVRNDNRDRPPPLVRLRALRGPGAQREPVITVMMADEDRAKRGSGG